MLSIFELDNLELEDNSLNLARQAGFKRSQFDLHDSSSCQASHK